MALVTLWIALWLHTFIPVIAAQIQLTGIWESINVLGMDLQHYPWTPEVPGGDITLSENELSRDRDAKNIVTYGNIV